MAKVMALYEVKVNQWDRTRDYFVAMVASSMMSSKENPVSPSDLLGDIYQSKADVKFTPDPDIDGAVWEGSKTFQVTGEDEEDGSEQ